MSTTIQVWDFLKDRAYKRPLPFKGIVIRNGGLTLANGFLKYHEQKSIHLTNTQFRMMQPLVLRMGRMPISNDEMCDWLYDNDDEPHDALNCIRVQMLSIKRKMKAIPYDILNRYSFGYTLEKTNA